MADTADASMSAHEAAGYLADLGGYEETLTARTAGLTWMIWGTAVPGIFTTYNAAGPWLESQAQLAWIMGVLWIPWILGASLATNWLWKATAVTLEWDTSPTEGWRYAAGFTLAFFALAGVIWLVIQATAASIETNGWMLISTGLLTMLIGIVYRRQHVPGQAEALVGGTLLAGAGVAISAAGLTPDVLAGLVSAGLVGLVYYAMGVRLYLDG